MLTRIAVPELDARSVQCVLQLGVHELGQVRNRLDSSQIVEQAESLDAEGRFTDDVTEAICVVLRTCGAAVEWPERSVGERHRTIERGDEAAEAERDRRIVAEVAAGALKAGARLAEYRAFAQQLLTNPQAVARAYADLEWEGVLKKHPSGGMEVAPGADRICRLRLQDALNRRKAAHQAK